MDRYEPSSTAVVHHRGRITVTERDISLIERQAAILARSSVVPLNNAADIAMIGMKALSLGVDPMAAFDDIYVVPSKGGPKLTISARMRVALARRAGCTVWFSETTDEQATCCLRRRGERDVHRITYTIAQAKRAGLTGDNWAKHPAAMLRAAAARNLVNAAAQDVLLGIGGMHDVDLDADVADLDIPDDIVDHGAGHEVSAGLPVEMADADTVGGLLDDIVALDDKQRDWLKKQLLAGHIVVREGRIQAGEAEEVAELIRVARDMFPTPDDSDPFDEEAQS